MKLSALTALLPLAAIVLLGRRRRLSMAATGALAVVAAELLLYRNELGPIAHGAVGQHTSALGSSRWSRSANVHRLVHFLNWHTPLAWLVLVAAIGSVWAARRAGVRLLGALWLWVPAAAAFVLAMKPLLDHHLVILAVAIAVPAGAALGLTVSRLGAREARSRARALHRRLRRRRRLPAAPAARSREAGRAELHLLGREPDTRGDRAATR